MFVFANSKYLFLSILEVRKTYSSTQYINVIADSSFTLFS